MIDWIAIMEAPGGVRWSAWLGGRTIKRQDGEFGYVLSSEKANGLPQVLMVPVSEIHERLRSGTLRCAEASEIDQLLRKEASGVKELNCKIC